MGRYILNFWTTEWLELSLVIWQVQEFPSNLVPAISDHLKSPQNGELYIIVCMFVVNNLCCYIYLIVKYNCFIAFESAQDIFSAGISLLSLLIGRKRVFHALSPEAQLCEMTFFYGTQPMENLGIAFAKILRFILLEHSLWYSHSNHVYRWFARY